MSLNKFSSLADMIASRSRSSSSSSNSVSFSSSSSSHLTSDVYNNSCEIPVLSEFYNEDNTIIHSDKPTSSNSLNLVAPRLKKKTELHNDFVVFDKIFTFLCDSKVKIPSDKNIRQILIDIFCYTRPADSTFVENLYKSCNREQVFSLTYLVQEVTLNVLKWLNLIYKTFTAIKSSNGTILETENLTKSKCEDIITFLLDKFEIHKDWLTSLLTGFNIDAQHSCTFTHYIYLIQFIVSSLFCLETKIFVNVFQSLKTSDVALKKSFIWYSNMYAFALYAKCKFVADFYNIKTKEPTNLSDIKYRISLFYLQVKPHVLLISYFIHKSKKVSCNNSAIALPTANNKQLAVSNNTHHNATTKYSSEKKAVSQKLRDLLYNFNWTQNWQLKSKFIYTWCSQLPNDLALKQNVTFLVEHFRKMFAMTWFYIPPCLRRAINLVNKTHTRLSYKDQLKFCWFLFSSFFKPLLLDKKGVDEHTLSVITISLLKSLQEYTPSSSDDKYGEKHQKRFADIYRPKINAHRSGSSAKEKDKIAMFSCNTLAGLAFEEDDKDLTGPTFRQAASKTTDKSTWIDADTKIICPFSAKNKTLHTSSSEWENIASIPCTLLADVEDLGFVMSTVRPSPMDEPPHVKSALKKSFITDNLFSTSISAHLSVTCLSCNVDYCMKSKTQEITSQDIQATSEKKFIFKNPTDRFLQDVCLGIGQQ